MARRFVMKCLAHDVTDAVLAPGSRSGALALALHAADAQGLLRLHVRVDEREAGFLALGLAKASGRIVPVITTSGTAVANLHPAMLEALHSNVPVLAVTADRPERLRGTGANQTTHQPEIFGPRIAYANRVEAFPVGGGHLNLEFDEPIVEPIDWDFPLTEWATTITARPVPHVLATPRRTVIVAGDNATALGAELAATHGLPLLAEPSSGSRHEGLPAYRLCVDEFGDQIERVISLGHATLSRPITRLLARADLEIIHVGDQSTFPVPAGDNVTFVESVDVTYQGDEEWLAQWQAASARALAEVEPHSAHEVARAVWEASDGGLLIVGSSNSIRHLDLVADGGRRLVLANRGLAGIDGTLSTAIGAALAARRGPAFALVGDLTFLHGANGLLIGPDEPVPDLTIVVANDDGGAIFAGLEQGGPEYSAAFERVFGTPTNTDLAALCRAHGVAHERVEPTHLPETLAQPARGIRVIEVPLTRPPT